MSIAKAGFGVLPIALDMITGIALEEIEAN
jgi:hypothetical protein